jgi:hypothetical protein
MFCLYVSEYRAITDLKSDGPFVFVTETQRVFCAVGTEFVPISGLENFFFTPLLTEGRAGEAWELYNNALSPSQH